MNVFIVYIALPALFFNLLAKTPVEQFSNLSFIAVATFSTFLIFCVTFVIAGFRNGGDVAGATIQGFAGAYGNIGYMAPPLAIAAFGPLAGVPVALVFCFENTMHFILAPLLMGLKGDNQQLRFMLVFEVLWKIISHPFIVATIFGVIAAFLEYNPPKVIDEFLGMLAGAAAPCALFSMGLVAALRPLKRVPIELSYILPIKLILHPLLTYFLLIWLLPELDPIWLYSATLMATLPTATNVFVLAQQYGVWQERASSAVVVSTLLAMISVTFYLYLIKS